MIKTYVSDGKGSTKEQLDEVKEAEKSPIVFDSDCPELSPKMEKAFRSAVVQRHRRQESSDVAEKTKDQKRAAFLATAGKIDIDEDAVKELRERSMV